MSLQNKILFKRPGQPGSGAPASLGVGCLRWNSCLCADPPTSRLLSWNARCRPPKPPDLRFSTCRGMGRPPDCPRLPVCCGCFAHQTPSNPCGVPLAKPSSPPLPPTPPLPRLLTPLSLARPAPANSLAPAQAAHYSGRLLLALDLISAGAALPGFSPQPVGCKSAALPPALHLRVRS